MGWRRPEVETDDAGYIRVDDQLRTSVPGIWALGDCNGKGAFTHTSYNDYEIVAANLLDNDPRKVSDRIMTYALFVDPPAAEARASWKDCVSEGLPGRYCLHSPRVAGRLEDHDRSR